MSRYQGVDVSKTEKHYILHRPSARGMGSNTDEMLVTESNLQKMFTEEEINRSLNECTTYAGVPDLIEIPQNIPILLDTLHFEDVIFRVFNQWLFERDVIVGDAVFQRYRIDFTSNTIDFGRRLQDRVWYEFMDYDLKHVSENHFFLFYHVEDLLRAERDRIKRLEGEADWDHQVRCAKANVAKFETLLEMKDEYYKHFYHQIYPEDRGGATMTEIIEDGIKRDDVDHTKCAYCYPLLPDKFACEINRDDYPGDRLRYDELFSKGTDIRHLVADYTGEAEKLEDFADPQIDWALETVFGYD